MEKTIKILFAEDSKLWREILVKELSPFNIDCIGQAVNGYELLELLETKNPDIVLLDLRMPLMDGDQTLQILKVKFPGLKIIILSHYCEEELIEAYINRGVKGYLPKDELTVNMLMEAITEVHNGGEFFKIVPAKRKKYTERQLEMIPLICNGLTNKEIAKEIYLSEWGVEKQRKKIYSKAGTKNSTEFFKYAFQEGLNFIGKTVKKK